MSGALITRIKTVFKILLFSIISLILIFFLIAIIHECDPDPIEKLPIEGSAQIEEVGQELTVLSWNIGYGGLGKDADSFLDGGSSSKPKNRSIVDRNLRGIFEFLKGHKSDVYMFQEVDRDSDRSFNIDVFKLLNILRPNLESSFAVNFKVFMLPVPILDPVGKVHAGLVISSKIKAQTAMRYSLPSVDFWPEKLFHLKRCLLVSRYKIKSRDKNLVLIDLHLSAYDDGAIRERQMKLLKDLILKEFKDGNSVIVGGDWNQRMPGVTKDQFGSYTTDEKYLTWAQKIDENWTPKGWKWAFDDSVPTVRNNESSYEKGVNFTTVIDGFLLSPDLEVESIKSHDLEFEFSDHNPVVMKVIIPAK